MLPRILHLVLLLAPAGGAEFVGSTPCDPGARQFLGGLAPSAPCMSISWRLRLAGDRFGVSASYFVPTRANPNLAEAGPSVERNGAWTLERGTAADSEANVVRLHPSLAFARLGGRLLHLLDSKRRLMAGNGGWSYTLNLSGKDTLGARVPEPNHHVAAAAAAAPLAGVFDGRTPCEPLARQFGLTVSGECVKMKWRLRLHADSTYVLEYSGHRDPARTGRFTTRASRGSVRGVVCQLDPDAPRPFLAFLQADDDVLLFLGHDGEPLVGNADFSYALSRQR